MYKVFTSLWSKPPSPLSTSTNNKTRSSLDTSIDEDGWILVSDTVLVSKITSPNDNNSIMTNSWIASPPLMRTDESPSINRTSSPNTHHFNPIENLLIEHASMSVYEQIASRTRAKRHRKTVHDNKLDEQVEEVKDDGDNNDDDDDDDDDDRSSVVLQYPSQHPNLSSVHHRNLTTSLTHSTNSSISSTSSLVVHRRQLHRIHQRRRRSIKTSTNNVDKSNQTFNKIIERQRLNYARTPKLVLHQPSRSNH